MTSSLKEGGTAVFRPSEFRTCHLFLGEIMKCYQFKQRFHFGGEKIDIYNQDGQLDYQIEGSFFQIPKTFTVYGRDGQKVSEITKELLTFQPRFSVQMANSRDFYLQKKWTFFRDQYEFEGLGLTVEGDIWDWNFQLKDSAGQVVAEITKEFFRLISTYNLSVYDEDYADLVISLVTAIDYVEMLENNN